MRKIIEITADYYQDISKDLDLNKVTIKRLWTVYDEEQLWDSYNEFDSQTGEKLPERKITIDDLNLRHNNGVFIEDAIHDWSIRNGLLNYYSRIAEKGSKVKILIEYDTL